VATQAEYDAVRAAVLKAITDEENRDVPAWEPGLIPANLVPNLAALCSKTAVDTLDAFRAGHVASKGASA
jgi:hypothetical protein